MYLGTVKTINKAFVLENNSFTQIIDDLNKIMDQHKDENILYASISLASNNKEIASLRIIR